ncbi:hypothetical protein FF38_04053 [Lucilia cuprina]|uniref:Uncharacterized protein n=1 Tax=Lucilia cuprina TaxID=7375 RepID=A0A0L0CI70_LUCCU|nr:hypothetical protein FF38_04053 [Lucilia cuprina]
MDDLQVRHSCGTLRPRNLWRLYECHLKRPNTRTDPVNPHISAYVLHISAYVPRIYEDPSDMPRRSIQLCDIKILMTSPVTSQEELFSQHDIAFLDWKDLRFLVQVMFRGNLKQPVTVLSAAFWQLWMFLHWVSLSEGDHTEQHS